MSEVKEQTRETSWSGRFIQTVTILGIVVGIVASSIFIYTTFFGPQSSPPPYSYGPTTPGPGCDSGPGKARWALEHGSVACLPDASNPDRMQLIVAPGDGTGIGQVFFYGTKQLPKNARVTVDIDSLPEGACAGVIMRNSVKHLGGYAFEVCHDGTSAIGVYAVKGSPATENPAPLVPGPGGPAISTCHLVVTVDGVSLRLKINDNPEFTASDGQFTENDAVSLFVTPPQGAAAVAVSFQNFTINEVHS